MTNIAALRALCKAICSAFYIDEDTLEFALFNNNIDAESEATAKDKELLKIAVKLVRGFVESSRSENGVSTSIDREAIDDSIKAWCAEYGVDVSDVIEESLRVIEDGSNLW